MASLPIRQRHDPFNGLTKMNTLTQKFANIPVDEGTRITSEKIIQINGIDAMHQCWFWEGVHGQSLIFCQADLEGISEPQLVEMLRSSLLAQHHDENISVNETGYVFVNFGFRAD